MIAHTLSGFRRFRSRLTLAVAAGALVIVASACEPFAIGQKALVPERSSLRPLSVSSPDTESSLMHGDCRYCHVEGNQVVRSNPSLIPHKVSGWEQCSTCHSEGRLAAMPVQHGGTADSQCQMCHKASSTPPPQMAHLGFTDRTCTSCHGPVVALPSTHKDRAEYTCELCHTPAIKAPPEAPHAVMAGELCSSCHGGAGALALPASHSGRNDELCVLCHQQRKEGTPAIPHTVVNRQNCLECHLPGTGAAISEATFTR